MNIIKLATILIIITTIQYSISQAAEKYPENDQISYLCKYQMSLTEGTEEIKSPLAKFCNDKDFEEPSKK